MSSVARAIRRAQSAQRGAQTAKRRTNKFLEQLAESGAVTPETEQRNRRRKAKGADQDEIKRLIRNGVIDLTRITSLAYLTQVYNSVGEPFKTRSRFVRALSAVVSQLHGQNPDGSWPNGTRDSIKEVDHESTE